jgi:hypothetical protein
LVIIPNCSAKCDASWRDAAWATSDIEAINKARVFCWERRKGLNKDRKTGYFLKGHIVLLLLGKMDNP